MKYWESTWKVAENYWESTVKVARKYWEIEEKKVPEKYAVICTI